MEPKITVLGYDWNDFPDIINKDELIILIYSKEDSNECIKIIENSNIKKIKSCSLKCDFEFDKKRDYYTFKITNLKQNEKSIVTEFIDRHKHENLSSILKLIEVFVNKISSELTFSKLEGDIGEAIFIKKCIELGFKKEIYDYCNNNFDSEKRIDFVINNKKFEIKTTTYEKQEINISDKQILENPNVVVITAEFSQNKIDIISLYKEIEKLFNDRLPAQLLINYLFYTKEEHYNFTKNRTLNNDKEIKFNFYDNSKLPKINIDGYDNIIKKITYTLNSYTEENNEEIFNKMLINKINS